MFINDHIHSDNFMINSFIIHSCNFNMMDFESRYYNRQTLVLGEQTQAKVRSLKVFIFNLTTLGLQVAKNLVMMGVRQLALLDSNIVSHADAYNSIYFDQSTIGKLDRARACREKLQKLTNNTQITIVQTYDSQLISREFDVAILVDCWDYNLATTLNLKMRALNKGFILVGNLSLFGFIFVDFGYNHCIMDKNGQRSSKKYIKRISNEKQAYLELCDGDKSLNIGDSILIYNAKGMNEINGKTFKVIEKHYAYKIDADTSQYSQYEFGGIIIQPRQNPSFVSFSSLEQSLTQNHHFLDEQQNIDTIVSRKRLNIRQAIILKSFFAFYSKYRRLPSQYSPIQKNQIINLAQSLHQFTIINENTQQIIRKQLEKLSYSCGIQISPFATIWGGITAQQVIKLTGKYTPINQWMNFDQMNLIDIEEQHQNMTKNIDECHPIKSLFGNDVQQKLQKLNVMVVGAGSLGCEYLKMFCEMNLGVNQGGITIVDDDILSDNNLNRMCLAQKLDVGRSKVDILSQKCKKINQKININVLKQKLGNENQGLSRIIPQKCWKNQDMIISGVDNVNSRVTIDKYCHYHKKIMLNCGSQDLKISTDVIIPHRSGSYADLSDNIAQTQFIFAKNTIIDEKIQHSVKRSISDLQYKLAYSSILEQLRLDKEKFIQNYLKEQKRYGGSSYYQQLESILRFYKIHKTNSYQKCVQEALIQFYLKFTQFPTKLKAFWSKGYHVDPQQKHKKNIYQIIKFDGSEPIHSEYIHSLSTIYAEILGIKSFSQQDTVIIAKSISNNEEFQSILQMRLSQASGQSQIMQKNQKLVIQFRENKFDFGKTYKFTQNSVDESHISFIYASSILNARVFQVQETSRLQIQKLACKTVPTIITSLSISSGFVVLELLKLLTDNYKSYKNTYANFAIPFIVQSHLCSPNLQCDTNFDPMMLAPIKFIPEFQDNWDAIYIVGPLTIAQMKRHFENSLKIVIESIMESKSGIFLHGYNQNVNRTVENMEVSVAYQHLSKDKNKEIQYPIRIFILGMCQEQSVDVSIPIIHYYSSK